MSKTNSISLRNSITSKISSSRLWQRKEAAGDDKDTSRGQQKLWGTRTDKNSPEANVESAEERSRSLSPPKTTKLGSLATETTRPSDHLVTAKKEIQRQLWSEGRGHAHDPLQDHPYLDVGPHPSEDSSPDKPHNPQAVSESPGAADFDVFAKAYQDEVGRIRQVQGEAAAIFSTWRVDKNDPNKRLGDLLGDAVHKTSDQ